MGALPSNVHYVFVAVFLLLAAPLNGQYCQQWSQATAIGELPPQLREASGIAASATFPERLYHINDSGDAGRFYITGSDGTGARAVSIVGFRPRDTEALSLGWCPGRHASCLYIGDIGDNGRRRKTIEVIAVEEAPSFSDAVRATARLTLRYPDGPHDAESMAVHPNGTLLVLTKQHPARLYKARLNETEQTLELVTILDTRNPPTDMAISPDGSRVAVLTYVEAVEFGIDFKDPRRIQLMFLQQQESITYLPDSRSLIYSTERGFAKLVQPILRIDCSAK